MTYDIPSAIAWVFDDLEYGQPVLHLMEMPDGVPLVLTGTAALIWLFAAQGQDVVAALTDVVLDPPTDLAETTELYLADLVHRGLLAEVVDGTSLTSGGSGP